MALQLLSALVLLVLASHASANQYTPTSPPSPYHYQHPPYGSKPPPPSFTAEVCGKVYCDVCKNGHFKKPIQGATVGVFCWNGKWEESFYGTTDYKGAFKIELKGFDYVRCGGGKACAVKLISPSYATPCTVPTDLHGGIKSVQPHVRSKSEHGVILEAGPFAYQPTISYPKCYNHPTYGTSPPPCPPPPYKYK